MMITKSLFHNVTVTHQYVIDGFSIQCFCLCSSYSYMLLCSSVLYLSVLSVVLMTNCPWS